MSVGGADLNIGVNVLGELCSLNHKKDELMWGGGRPESLKTDKDRVSGGWDWSSPNMFPLIGPPLGDVPEQYIILAGKLYDMMQHGFLRHMRPKIQLEESDSILSRVSYDGNGFMKPGLTSNFPNQFTFSQRFQVRDGTVHVDSSINNDGNRTLSYAYGLHPAFYALQDGVISCGKETFTLGDVLEAGTLFLPESDTVTYHNDARSIEVQHNLGHTWVWAQKVSNGQVPLVCVEPVTGIAEKIDDKYIGKWKTHRLPPGSVKEFSVLITPRIVT